jgi:1-phosphofructokinase family hexose kinase
MGQENRVVTVTINPAIDQTITIPNFTAGAVNRVQSSQMDAGGKGINVASFLADFGQPATVTGFLGADNDDIFRRQFERKGIEDRCVRIAGQTRIGVKVSDEVLHQTTDINFPGETPNPADIAQLFEILAELAVTHEWFVLSGSIPRGVSAGIYAEMVRTLAGKKVVLDTSGEGFRQAVPAGPWLIKPNVDELSEYAGKPLDSPTTILEQARAVMGRYNIHSVVISMGKEGAIFVEGDEMVWAVPPVVEVKSTVGAGDAMVAGIVAGKMRGLALAECARLATAFSVTAISHIGSGLPSIEAVQSARERVTIRELSKA